MILKLSKGSKENLKALQLLEEEKQELQRKKAWVESFEALWGVC